MVGLAAQDLEASIDLLEREQPDEPVGDGQPAERDEPGRPRAHRVIVAVGATDRGLMLSVPSPNNVNSFARAVLADGNAPTTQKVTLTVYYLSLYPHN